MENKAPKNESGKPSGGAARQKETSFYEDSKNIEIVSMEKTDFQPAQGRLIEPQEPSPYETVDEKFEQVPIEAIQAVGLIPDYSTSTDLKYPTLAKTPLNYYCLDGSNLIQEAKDSGKIVLKCFVEYMSEDCVEELAIRKVSMREKPRGGISSYSESVRNTTYLMDILTASELDLRVFQHGGSRRGETFTENKQQNINKLLSSRLGKSVSTIVKYLNHGFLLTYETLNFLAEKEADKDFFETVQANKRWMINNLKSQGVSDEEISLQISESMIAWFREYEENSKKIKRAWDEAVVENEDVNHREATPALPLPRENSNQEVAIPPVTSTEPSEEPVMDAEILDEHDSFETLKFSVEASAKRLVEASTLSDPTEYLDRITAETKNLAILLKKASVLRNKGLPFTAEVLQ